LLQLLTAGCGPLPPTGDVRYHGEYWGHSGPAEVIGIPTVLIRKKHSVSRRASDSEAFLLTCYVALRADVKGKSATYCFSETPMVLICRPLSSAPVVVVV